MMRQTLRNLVPSAMALAICTTTAVTPVRAADRFAPDQEQLVTASELAAMVAHPEGGRATSDLLASPRYRVMAVARWARGEAELHDVMADIFIVQAGTADVLIGGTLAGAKTIAPDEHRGGTITGGRLRHVRTGDVLWIPAGMPHRVIPTGPSRFRYLVVKVAKSDEDIG